MGRSGQDPPTPTLLGRDDGGTLSKRVQTFFQCSRVGDYGDVQLSVVKRESLVNKHWAPERLWEPEGVGCVSFTHCLEQTGAGKSVCIALSSSSP